MMNVESTPCRTTHYACECVIEKMRKYELLIKAAEQVIHQMKEFEDDFGRIKIYCRECGNRWGQHKYNCTILALQQTIDLLKEEK